MKTYMAEVLLPDAIWDSRKILAFQEKGDYFYLWKEKDLNNFYPGRPWRRKIGSEGILATQRCTEHIVRILVRSETAEGASNEVMRYVNVLPPARFRSKKARQQRS